MFVGHGRGRRAVLGYARILGCMALINNLVRRVTRSHPLSVEYRCNVDDLGPRRPPTRQNTQPPSVPKGTRIRPRTTTKVPSDGPWKLSLNASSGSAGERLLKAKSTALLVTKTDAGKEQARKAPSSKQWA